MYIDASILMIRRWLLDYRGSLLVTSTISYSFILKIYVTIIFWYELCIIVGIDACVIFDLYGRSFLFYNFYWLPYYGVCNLYSWSCMCMWLTCWSVWVRVCAWCTCVYVDTWLACRLACVVSCSVCLGVCVVNVQCVHVVSLLVSVCMRLACVCG
jgi:hypothetical protein